MSIPWILTFIIIASLLPSLSHAMSSLFDPISTSPPVTGFQRRSHPVHPSCVSPSSTVGTPTHKFWSNLYLQPGTDPIYPNPFALRLKTESPWGWEISHTMVKGTSPGIGNAQPGMIEYYFNPFLSNWAFSAVEHVNTKPTLQIPQFDLMCVQLKMSATSAPQGSYQIPLCYGNAYITIQYTALTPLFSTMHALLLVNGQTPSSHTGTRFVISLNSGQTWIIYTQSSITLLKNSAGQLQASTPYNGWIQITLSPNDAGTNILDTYAGTWVKGVTLDATVSGSVGTYSHIYTLGGNAARPVLHYLLPHHQAIVTTGVKTNLALPSTTKGLMYAYTTSSGFIFQENALPTEMNFLPAAEPSESDLAITLYNLEYDINSITAEWIGMDASNYFGAKHLQKLAMLCLLADKYVSRVGATVRATCVSRLEQAFAYWLEWRNGNVLRYDTVWGGIIGQNGLDLDGADFFSTYYNDHHYHWGYVLVAASTLVKLNPSWATPSVIEFINTLVRDVANPATADPYFPRFRSFDFYNGHSWARGILTTPDGKDQESTSEEVNFHYGLALWGMMTSNQQLQDWGRLTFAIAARSVRTYFLIEATNTVHPANFIGNKVTGIFFEAKVHYATWFGSNHWYMHGIQMLPMIAWTPMVRTKQFVAEEWVVIKRFLAECMASDSRMWASTLLLNLALIDKKTAFAFLADESLQYDDGLTRTWALYFASTQDNNNVPQVPQDAIAPPPVTVPPYPTVPTGTRPPSTPGGVRGVPATIPPPDTTIDTPADIQRQTFVAGGVAYILTASLSGACRTITLTLTAPADVQLTSVQFMTAFSTSTPMTDISQPGCTATGSASSLTCSMWGGASLPLYLYVMWNVASLNYRQQYPLPMPNASPFASPFVFRCSASTQAPVTQAPVTQAPVTQAPVTQAPVTQAPVTQAPTTQAPVRVTQAPVTQAPVPVTQAPTSGIDTPSDAKRLTFVSGGLSYTITASLNGACSAITLTLTAPADVQLTSVQFMTVFSPSVPTNDISQPGCLATGQASSLSCSMGASSSSNPLYLYVMWNVAGLTYRQQYPLPMPNTSPFTPPFVFQCGGSTQAPVTQAPVTQAPVTQAPATQKPVTQAPATQAPVTQAPVTQAPATQAPVTQAPVTQAPPSSGSSSQMISFTSSGTAYTVTASLNSACNTVTLTLSGTGVTLTSVQYMTAYSTSTPMSDISQPGCTATGSASSLSCSMPYRSGVGSLYAYVMWNVAGVTYRMQQPLPMPGVSPFLPPFVLQCGGGAPATQAPVTQAPVTQAPVTEAPATQAPVTQAPTTKTPVTPAPVPQAPATQRPTVAATAPPPPTSNALIFPFTAFGSSYTVTGTLNSACDQVTLSLTAAPGVTLTVITFMIAYATIAPTTDISQFGCTASGSASTLSCTMAYKNEPLYVYAMWNAAGVSYRMQQPLPMPGVSPFFPAMIFTCGGSGSPQQPEPVTLPPTPAPTPAPTTKAPATQAPTTAAPTSAPTTKAPVTQAPTTTAPVSSSDPTPSHVFTAYGSTYTITGQLNSACDTITLTISGTGVTLTAVTFMTAWADTTPTSDISQPGCSASGSASSLSCTMPYKNAPLYLYAMWNAVGVSYRMQHPLPMPGVSPFLSPFIFTCANNAVQPGTDDTDGAMVCPTLCPLYAVPPVVTSFTSQLKHPYTAIMTLTNGCTNPEHTFTLVSRDDQHLTSLGVYIAYDGQCDIKQRDCSQRVCYTSTTLGSPSISCTFSGRPQGYTSHMYVYFLWTTESQSGNQQYPLPAPAFIDINLPCDQMKRTGWDGTCTDTSAITTCACRTGYFGLACQSQQPIYTSSSSIETQDDTIVPIVQSRSTATESASYLTPLLLSTAIALTLAGVGTFLFKRHKSRRAAMELKPYSLTIENVEYNPVRRVDSTTFSPSVHALIPSRSTDQLISPSSSIDPMVSPASAALQMESNYSSSDSP